MVVNKTDLPPAWDLAAAGTDAISISALTGAGLPELCAGLARRLVPESPPGAAVPFSPRVGESLAEAHDCLRGGHHQKARDLVMAIRAGEVF
jgi:hypothetical protein